ncbi:hypothetical protein DCO46_17885 [Flavobacterium sp. HTF]|nr:hypothetical protein DCO46_17885 [Flavobacterium sp. HTF]
MDFIKKISIPYFVLFVFFMFYKPVICFLMLGIFALVFAVYSILFLNIIRKNGIETTGKIVSYDSDGEGYKTPVIEFQIGEEETITAKPFLHTSSDLDKFRSYQGNIYKPVKIIYNSESPEKFILKDNSHGCGLIIIIMAGLVFAGIAIGNLLGYNDIF